jgi:hypothetical protein
MRRRRGRRRRRRVIRWRSRRDGVNEHGVAGEWDWEKL